MPCLSKLNELTLPYNCYEVGHTWSPFCSEAALIIGLHCFQESLKIYSPLYLASQIFNKKFDQKGFIKTFKSTLTSSCFLSFNAFSFMVIFCLFRKIMGKFYFFYCSYFPAFLASYLAILIETPSRRGPLALYVTNVASETFFRMAVSRNYIKAIPNGEVYLFSATMSLFLYIIRQQGFSKDFVSIGIKYLLGSSVAKTSENDNYIKNSNNNNIIQQTSENLPSWPFVKLQCCPHHQTCFDYVIKGMLKPFALGLGISSLLTIARPQFLAKPLATLSKLMTYRNFKLGLFLGSFGGIYKASSCLLRKIFGMDSPLFSLPAGFLAGMSMHFSPNSSLSLYLMWKLIELLYILGMKQGLVPYFGGGSSFLYAASTAVLFYAAILEPHNLKPAYYRFLNRITNNKIGLINRLVLDIFGTNASQYYGDFFPAVDIRYTSSAFKETIILWLL